MLPKIEAFYKFYHATEAQFKVSSLSIVPGGTMSNF